MKNVIFSALYFGISVIDPYIEVVTGRIANQKNKNNVYPKTACHFVSPLLFKMNIWKARAIAIKNGKIIATPSSSDMIKEMGPNRI